MNSDDIAKILLNYLDTNDSNTLDYYDKIEEFLNDMHSNKSNYKELYNRVNELINKRKKEVEVLSKIIMNDNIPKEERKVLFCKFFPFRDAKDSILLNLMITESVLENKTPNELDTEGNFLTFDKVICSLRPEMSNEDNTKFKNNLDNLLKSTRITRIHFNENTKLFHVYGDELVAYFSNNEIEEDFKSILNEKDPQKRNHIIGRYAEYLFYKHEKEVLEKLKYKNPKYQDIIDNMIWVSKIGDGFGYDFITHDIYGNEILVEIKGTASEKDKENIFYLTDNENEYFENSNRNYYIYKINLKDKTPLIVTYRKDRSGNIIKVNAIAQKEEVYNYEVENYDNNKKYTLTKRIK